MFSSPKDIILSSVDVDGSGDDDDDDDDGYIGVIISDGAFAHVLSCAEQEGTRGCTRSSGCSHQLQASGGGFYQLWHRK